VADASSVDDALEPAAPTRARTPRARQGVTTGRGAIQKLSNRTRVISIFFKLE
jgi:hypothetical protein